MSAFQPPELAKHEHVIAESGRFGGWLWTRPFCAHCGVTLGACLQERGCAITRPGWESPRFTDWSRGVRLVQA